MSPPLPVFGSRPAPSIDGVRHCDDAGILTQGVVLLCRSCCALRSYRLGEEAHRDCNDTGLLRIASGVISLFFVVVIITAWNKGVM